MKKCLNPICGFENSESAKFCGKCGDPILNNPIPNNINIDLAYFYKKTDQKSIFNWLGIFNWSGQKEEIKGIARSIHYDYESYTNKKGKKLIDAVINFRIEQVDKAGNPINYSTGKIRGGIIEGNITDGDLIKIKGKIVNGIIMLNEIKNITTNTIVRSKKLKLGYNEVIVIGNARMVQIMQQQRNLYWNDNVMNLRIEQTDKEGNVINFTPVELRGLRTQGSISDGDQVKVKGRMIDGTLFTNEIINVSTNSMVKVK